MTELPTTANIEISGKVNLSDVTEMLWVEHEDLVNSEIKDHQEKIETLQKQISDTPTGNIETHIRNNLDKIFNKKTRMDSIEFAAKKNKYSNFYIDPNDDKELVKLFETVSKKLLQKANENVDIEVSIDEMTVSFSNGKEQRRYRDHSEIKLNDIVGISKVNEYKYVNRLAKEAEKLRDKISELETHITPQAKKRIKAGLTRNVLKGTESGQQLLSLVRNIAANPKALEDKN